MIFFGFFDEAFALWITYMLFCFIGRPKLCTVSLLTQILNECEYQSFYYFYHIITETCISIYNRARDIVGQSIPMHIKLTPQKRNG